MKKTTNTMMMMMMMAFCLLSSCSNAQETTASVEVKQIGTDKKTLIVYLSRTNNTKAVAEMIQHNIGGDLVVIELKKPYPEDYKETVEQVSKENETGYLPPLKTKIDNIEKYDVVFVGFPTWGMQLPPPMKSFLNQYNLSGKTVIPFNTNAGYGIGSSFQTVNKLCKKSKILEGFSVKGGIERDGILFVMHGEKKVQVQQDVKKWLSKIKSKM
ncbi:flavodoxin [Flavobacterium sp. LT1R49]|uniref:flavodoxin n=1 Tax=Flavobacterium arabinosi TaxID=3398737 RepID=UPI003A8B4FEC